MKRKKLLDALLLAMLCIFSFTACSSDDDDDKNDDTEWTGGGKNSNGILGMWSAPNTSWKGTTFISVYNFINENTVVDYSTVSNSREGWSSGYTEMPGHKGWYYGTGASRNLTYYIYENKIYITDGHILTISGNTLLEDGSDRAYTKW